MQGKSLIHSAVLLIILASSVVSAQAAGKSSKGQGGGKTVVVTAAEPSFGNQGQELDVIISGDGFDSGSTAQYLITGTNDNTQIEVLSNEFIRSTKQLKTRVRVKNNATFSEYDIEVQTSSGRKGKGTTLFKVTKDETGANPALVIAGMSEPFVDLYLVDQDGSNVIQVLHNATYQRMRSAPTIWSASGEQIIYSFSDRWRSLRSVNADGSNIRELVRSTESIEIGIGGQRNIAAGAVDCNGQSSNDLYFLGGILDDAWYHTDFFVIDLDSVDSTPRRLTNDPMARHFTLATSPTEPLVAAWAYEGPEIHPGSEGSRLEIRDLCQQGLPVIYSWNKADIGLPWDSYGVAMAWSSIDLLAIVVAVGAQNEEIFFLDISDPSNVGPARKIAGLGTGFGEGVENHRAAWSPDGAYFAFISNYLVYYLDLSTDTYHFVVDPVLDRDIDWRPTWKPQP